MGVLRKFTPWEREYREVWRKEQWFLRRYGEKRETVVEQKLAELVPGRLTETFRAAFVQAFGLVFEKGDSIIRWAGRRELRRWNYAQQARAVETAENRETLRAFSGAANRAGTGNIAAAGVAGTGMGLFGVALPDVPLFTAMLLKSVYDTAESFGFPCEDEAEKIYVLRLIEAALSDGQALHRRSRELDGYAQTGSWTEAVSLDRQIRATAGQLSDAVLYSKALQSVPVAGAAGGIMSTVCFGRVQRYAAIKYQKRFLISRRMAD